MPKQEQYQARLVDGTVRTVMAYSLRGAARGAAAHFGIMRGEQFMVKKRLGGDPWIVFTKTKVGVRELGEYSAD